MTAYVNESDRRAQANMARAQAAAKLPGAGQISLEDLAGEVEYWVAGHQAVARATIISRVHGSRPEDSTWPYPARTAFNGKITLPVTQASLDAGEWWPVSTLRCGVPGIPRDYRPLLHLNRHDLAVLADSGDTIALAEWQARERGAS